MIPLYCTDKEGNKMEEPILPCGEVRRKKKKFTFPLHFSVRKVSFGTLFSGYAGLRIFFFNCSIADLQCCVSFRCMEYLRILNRHSIMIRYGSQTGPRYDYKVRILIPQAMQGNQCSYFIVQADTGNTCVYQTIMLYKTNTRLYVNYLSFQKADSVFCVSKVSDVM